MNYEVEHKYRVASFDALRKRLAPLDARPLRDVEQVDIYFAHPSRDFAVTDEALRLRRVGDANFITYKGPKIDATTKTRREIELAIGEGDFVGAEFSKLLEALSFRPVGEVRKRRRELEITWQDRCVHCALDDVVGLGTFVELELMAEEADLTAARECLASLAQALDLKDIERRSYLEMLLAG